MPGNEDSLTTPAITVKGRPSENGRTRKDGTPRRSFNMRIVMEDDVRAMQHKVVGMTTRLGVCAFLRVLFETNEGLEKFKKMTDTMILDMLKLEFPVGKDGRYKSKGVQGIVDGRYTIGKYRGQYNAGEFSGRKRPIVQSHRWGSGGILVGRTGKPLRGVRLQRMEEEVDRSLEYLKTREEAG